MCGITRQIKGRVHHRSKLINYVLWFLLGPPADRIGASRLAKVYPRVSAEGRPISHIVIAGAPTQYVFNSVVF